MVNVATTPQSSYVHTTRMQTMPPPSLGPPLQLQPTSTRPAPAAEPEPTQDIFDNDALTPPQEEDANSTTDKLYACDNFEVADGIKGARQEGPQPCQGQPTTLNEPEEEPNVNPAREKFKSLAAALGVLTFWICILTVLFILRSRYKVPDCQANWPNGEPVYDIGDLRSCETCGVGTRFLPLFGEWEKTWPQPIRVTLYLVGLLWCFLGIGIVCDQFMSAIEEITSAEQVVWVEVRGNKHKFHRKVWNATIANLTLMALGSSAPEILLSIIENVGNNFFAGSLGPSTIVGSAAFNLLIITAVCVSAIPAPDTRKIVGTNVYAVTASFSLFAYFWLIVILQWVTPDKVDLEEAILTFLFFPLLLIVAFLADKGWLPITAGDHKAKTLQRSTSWVEQETLKLQQKFGKELPQSALQLMLQDKHETTKPPAKSRAQYRKGLMSGLTSGKKVADKNKGSQEVVLGLEKAEYMVLECAGKLRIKLLASRPPGTTVQLRYFTQESSAKSGIRYTDVSGTLRFTAHQTERYFDIPIIDNDTWEPDEHFFVKVCDLQVITAHFSVHATEVNLEHRLGIDEAKVTIINDDMPGTLNFDFPEVFANEGTEVTVGINRSHGTCGQITCKYTAKDETAVKGIDYTLVEGTITFENGETHQTIAVSILPQTRKRFSDNRFKIELSEPSPGVLFDKETDGGEEAAICEIVISKTANSSKFLPSHSFINQHKVKNSLKEWRESFAAIWFCNGSAVDQAEAGPKDWIMHCLCLFWKLVFSLVPPASMMGGWASFGMALGLIGMVTALIGDLASLLGCSMGLADDITAITLIALGTSLPDTLASKTAAEEDETADNSVGNVTGSNSVNVFLGLGMPWCMAAVVWKVRGPTEEWREEKCRGCVGKDYLKDYLGTYGDGGFIVPASSLSFSVMVFTACALAGIMLLYARRVAYGGELGGPQTAQHRDSAILTLLWVIYVGMSIWQSTST